jgi:uncharacterized protein YbbK (DUF523 family)
MGRGKPRVAISACLLGEPVRWDGGHRRDPFLVERLGPLVEWVPLCPEAELGLGVPREPIALVGDPAAPRLRGATSGAELGEPMRRWSEARVAALSAEGIDGVVLKARSPSCGLADVPVLAEGGGAAPGAGTGLFAAALRALRPDLPAIDEVALADPGLRRAFLERLFARTGLPPPSLD